MTFSKYVELKAGDNKLAILSVSIGLPVSFFISNIFIIDSELTQRSMSECWPVFRHLECWRFRPGDVEGSARGHERHVGI